MYSFRKSKKGFTLIELMVVVAIIAILALLGLRLYTTQQRRAKEAMVRANAGTVQVSIQTELVDVPPATLDADLEGNLPDLAQLRNPFTNVAGFGEAWGDDTDADIEGIVAVFYSGGVFTIIPYGEGGAEIDYSLTARR